MSNGITSLVLNSEDMQKLKRAGVNISAEVREYMRRRVEEMEGPKEQLTGYEMLQKQIEQKEREIVEAKERQIRIQKEHGSEARLERLKSQLRDAVKDEDEKLIEALKKDIEALKNG